MQKSGVPAQSAVTTSKMYDSVKPEQEIIFDPTKSINLLIDNPENHI